MSELQKIVSDIEKEHEHKMVDEVADIIIDAVKEHYPVLQLDQSFPSKNLLSYSIHTKHYVKIFYFKKIIIFENEKDKTMFLLKWA